MPRRRYYDPLPRLRQGIIVRILWGFQGRVIKEYILYDNGERTFAEVLKGILWGFQGRVIKEYILYDSIESPPTNIMPEARDGVVGETVGFPTFS